MAIDTEFIDFIVPIATIREKYLGGWEQCLKDHEHLLGGRVWYDDYLFRNVAMNPGDIGPKIEAWTDRGFSPFKEVDGKKHWLDFCVHEGMYGGATLPCDWLVGVSRYQVAHVDDPYPDIVKHEPARIESED